MSDVDLRVTCSACPLQLEGTVNGRPVVFHSRGYRWRVAESFEAMVEGVVIAEGCGGVNDVETAIALTVICAEIEWTMSYG